MPERWEEATRMEAAPPPFEHNPSAWSQRVPVCILAGLAALVSAYLGLYQVELIDSAWDPLFGDGTEQVLTSRQARQMDRLLHVPDAMFGAWAYLSEAVLGLAGSTRRWQFRPWMVLLFGIDVIPLGGVSALLVVLQGFVVGSWCFLCLVTAVISFVLIGLAYDEVWASVAYLRRVWRSTRDRRVLWRTFWGVPSEEAHRVALGMRG